MERESVYMFKLNISSKITHIDSYDYLSSSSISLRAPALRLLHAHRSSSESSRRDKKKARNSWRMAILNHAKDNRLGVWRPKQYETNGLRGRILVFRFLEPQSATPSSRRSLALRQPARLRALGVIFLSHIPSCAFITFKRDRRSRWCGCLSSSSAVLLLCPFLSSIFFCHGAPNAKKRGLFESQAGDRLSSGTSKGHNSATWNFPLREVVMVVVAGVSVFYASVYGHPHSFLLPIGGCMYTLVCFALVIHRVFCFKSLLRFQARVSINSIVRIR